MPAAVGWGPRLSQYYLLTLDCGKIVSTRALWDPRSWLLTAQLLLGQRQWVRRASPQIEHTGGGYG